MYCRSCCAFGAVVLGLAFGMNPQCRASELEIWSASSSLWPGHLSSEWVATGNPLTAITANAREREEVSYAPPVSLTDLKVGDFILPGNDGASPLMAGAQFSDPDPNDNAARLVFGNRSNGIAGGSEWDYLWENSSRVPVSSIPEPTSAALLIGGVILLWAGRNRKCSS